MKGSMLASQVLHDFVGISGGGPNRSGRADYASARQDYSRYSGDIQRGVGSPAPSLVLGLRATYPLLDIQSTLSRSGKLTGPWAGVTSIGFSYTGPTNFHSQLTSSQLAKVSG